MQKIEIEAPLKGEPGAAEYGAMDALMALAERKRMVVLTPLVAMIAALALGLIMTKTFRGSTVLLPPQQQQSGTAALLSQLGAGGAVMAGIDVKNPNGVYIAMLSSRRVVDRLVERFKLQQVFEEPSLERVRRTLSGKTLVKSGKDGLITIEVDDPDPKLAAALANGYVDELIALTKVLAVTEASQRRLFFERQLAIAKDELASAEMAFKSSLDSGGVVSVDSESRVVLETLGRVRTQISAREVQLNSMRAVVTTSNPQFMRIQQELDSLRIELLRLQNGRGGRNLDAASTPQRGLDNIKILRDVKYYQMLYELLSKQYEAARLDEAKDAAVIQVLDRAVPPEHKVAPKLSIMMLIAGLIGAIGATALAIMLDLKERFIATPAGARQWGELMARLHLRRSRRVA